MKNNSNIFIFKFSFYLILLLFVVIVYSQKSITVPDGYIIEKDIVYSTINGKELKLDLYWVKDAKKPTPLVIWIHGGGWRSGDKSRIKFAQHLLGKGFALASINYRLSQEAIFPAQIIDCKAAIRWLRAHARKYNLNPERFGVWGSSAGGHLVALLGTAEDKPEWEQGDYLEYSSRVQAVCDWYGPTDFLRMNDIPGKINHNAPDSPESCLIGGPIQKYPDQVALANPITYVHPENPPFLIMHGANDRKVIPGQSKLLYQALQKAGVKAELMIIKGLEHGGKGWDAQITKVESFFTKHLIQNPKKVPPIRSQPRRRWTYTYFSIPENIQYKRFRSQTINQDYGYMVYLPPGYEKDQTKHYPVVYWLPGRNGNPDAAWKFMQLTDKAIKAGNCPAMIVIGVNGIQSSMYCDDHSGQFPIETVIIQDLIPHVDATYRTIPKREKRAIEGFSMGGYGAARLGFKYPELFGAVSILSGALHKPEFLKNHRPEIFEEVFNNDLEACAKSSPWTIVQDYAKKYRKHTYIRIFVGEKDVLKEKNLVYHHILEKLQIPHEFGIVKNAKHNFSQLYANWDGNPFEFYQKAFRK